MKIFGRKTFLKIAALATAGLGASGCVYDVGLGYASDGYYDDAYSCDPYGGYDSYYNCDYGNGFYNIGFGGGWYDNYWYPGYGFYLFDNVGRRYPMRDNHRRYWGERRHNWYRENRGRHQDGGRYRGRDRGYSDNDAPSAIGWPERNGGRVRDGDDNRRGRGDGRRGRNEQWRGGEGRGADAVPTPNPEMVQRPGRGGQRGDGNGRPNRRSDDGLNAVPMPQPVQPGMRQGGRGERVRGGGEGRGYQQPSPQDAPAATQSAPPAPRAARPSRPERPSPRPGGDRMEQVDDQ